MSVPHGDAIVATKDFIKFSDDGFKIIASEREYYDNEPKFHNELEIKCCCEGSFSVIVNSTVYTLTAGDIVVINPYEIHENPKDMGGAGRYYSLVFDLNMLPDSYMRDDILLGKKKLHNYIKGNELLGQTVANIVCEMSEMRSDYRLASKNLIEYLFILLIRNGFSECGDGERSVSERELMKKISPSLSKIHTDYAGSITLDDLAAACLMSKYSFCRCFKSVMGVSPIQYLISYRISIAKTHLKNKALSCEEVGRLCGFDDISYFTRVYKKVTGISPGLEKKTR